MRETLIGLIPEKFRKRKVTIPVVRLSGVIQAGSGQFRQSLNVHSVEKLLKKAFDFKKAPAVAILINSPGGSPVQSRAIFQRIRDLAEEKGKKVLVYVEDVAASGGYLISLAGDEIIADPASIVGSIGVISGGFGFPELMKKIGVERRVYTAGDNKSVLDPFMPEKQSDIDHLKSLQLDIHRIFIDMVKARREGKLVDDETIFTGLFWSGERGLALGLVDQLGELNSDLKTRYGDDVRVEMMEQSKGFIRSLLPGAKAPEAIASATLRGLLDTMEEQALWSRYGR
jgi:serine protease SohB